ncbi:MAG: hypothetical protein OEZ06_14470 [Myxococcales bacterium]|nr:hypothetical protein [Myxococcales bacterium]
MQNAWCQECHGTEGFELRDQVTGEPRTLFVSSEGYARSSHGQLDCRRCHERGYRKVPHTHSGHYPSFLCVDCHRADPVGREFDLSERKSELIESVHGRHGSNSEVALDCHDCHDPHEFRPVRNVGRLRPRVAESNALCLPCHGAPAERLEAYRELRDMASAHTRFPNLALHLRKVKCISCHSRSQPSTGHDIAKRSEAVRECTHCHARDSELLGHNFQRPDRPPTGEDGSTSMARNAYVVGATRSAWLDRASLLGFFAMVLIVCVHGYARYRQRRGRRPTATAESRDGGG